MQRQIPIDEYKTKVQKSDNAILDWAANVHPGPPTKKHLSINTARARNPPAVVEHERVSESADTTSTSDSSESPVHQHPRAGSSTADLTAHGYSAVFVHLPNTPSTPSPLLRSYDQKHRTPKLESYAALPEKESKEKSRMPRLRSLNILRRPGAKGTPEDAPPVPALPASPSASTSKASAPVPSSSKPSKSTPSSSTHASSSASKAAIAARKRSQYGAYASSKGVPPPLAAELALMQFADGGKLETHARRVMERQALLAAGSRSGAVDFSSSNSSGKRNKTDKEVGRDVGYSAGIGGIAEVYRDAQGGMWYDAAEEQEYAHLLGGRARGAAVAPRWEAFEHGHANQDMDSGSESEDEVPAMTGGRRRQRRVSHASSATSEASLDARFLLPLPELEDPRAAPVDDRVLTSPRVVAPVPVSVVSERSSKEVGKALALPNRARRASRYLLEKAGEAREGFESQSSTPRPSTSMSSAPSSLRVATPTGDSRASFESRERSRGPARRRYAGPAESSASLAQLPARSQEEDRRAFIEDSFSPAPAPSSRQQYQQQQQQYSAQPPSHHHQQQYAQPAYYAQPLPVAAPIVQSADSKGNKFKIRAFFGGSKAQKV
ncbi:hypothetical protein D9619_007272 [Psilocybe cf. subviscida]|uniref:Uncharacterized protein n=1 Tax=Psilocybe cf. subviscida TaxID=2480587 RepID=A0A8H5B286_9AGAR|nr:hypothetical protein D9619_007272 [Psilocybe cf. subviscida]